MPTEALSLKQGLETTREALAKAFGGPNGKGRPSQGGIVPMRASSKLFVFSDPRKSKEHGYNFDGWAENDEQGPVFHYTGTGSEGDQVLSGFNGTLLHHEEQGLELHLFISDGYVKPGGARNQRYVGQMRVDSDLPVMERWDHDPKGALRRVYIFRLRPVESAEIDFRAKDAAQPVQETRAVAVPAKETAAGLVEPESHTTDETVASGSSEPRSVIRREGKLTTSFKAFLEAQGHTVQRYQIAIKGMSGRLLTDLYDVTDNVLYEAKGRSKRNDVRMAIGQLLDYRRHIQQDGLKLAILLPEEPVEDLRDLIEGLGIALVVQDTDGFAGYPVKP